MAKSQWYVQESAQRPAVAPPSPYSAPSIPAPFLRRWTIPLIGLTLVAVIGLLVLQIVLMKNSRRKLDEAAQSNETTKPGKESDEKPAPVKESLSKPSDEIAVRPSVARWEPPAVAKPAPQPMPMMEPKKPGRPSDAVLTLVDGLTTAHLYQTYLNVGLLADGVAKNVYTAEAGKELLENIGKLMDNFERQLAQLPVEELQPEERKHLEKIRSVISLLRSEIKELKTYWETGEEQYVVKFQKIHKNVWAELEKMLGGE